MTNLEEVKKKIQEVVPEIMELKFGCKFKLKGSNYIDICTGKNEWGLNDVEILGRPITLEDVLKAMQSLDDKNPQRHWVINRWGEFLNDAEGVTPLKGFSKVGEKWILGKPLDLQEENTINFLHGILCK